MLVRGGVDRHRKVIQDFHGHADASARVVRAWGVGAAVWADDLMNHTQKQVWHPSHHAESGRQAGFPKPDGRIHAGRKPLVNRGETIPLPENEALVFEVFCGSG